MWPPAAGTRPLGPQSLVWRYFGDNRMFLIGPRPAVLQNMLAELGQGVLGLPWSERQERRYQRFAVVCWSFNWLWDRLPMRLRYNRFARAGYARG